MPTSTNFQLKRLKEIGFRNPGFDNVFKCDCDKIIFSVVFKPETIYFTKFPVLPDYYHIIMDILTSQLPVLLILNK